MNRLFASTARGLEELLKSELEALGADDCKITQGGVYFQGDQHLLYKSLLWSRLASRILLILSEFTIDSDQALYQGIYQVDWPELFTVDKTFSVHFTGTNQVIRNSQYGALKVKDAIVDRFMYQLQQRPNVAKQTPGIRINVFLKRDRVSLALDVSGEGLHQRGYREIAGDAPLKENLAAAIVLRSGWQVNTPLVDPMCGSGTLLIEAALMATDQAPGLRRLRWGFLAWSGHNPIVWHEVLTAAHQRAKQGKQQATLICYGYDSDPRILEAARENARRAGVADLITFTVSDIKQLQNPFPVARVGTVLSNPPYGERLESEPALVALHNELGRVMKAHFIGWTLSVFSAAPMLLNYLQLRAQRQFKAKNGPLDCVQKNYYLTANNKDKASVEVAEDFANRLRKNLHKLEKWAKKERIECYRLYDADLPEYNVAIDRYADRVVVQEYAPPKSIMESKARKRLLDVITATLAVLQLPTNHLVLKTRQRQKGRQQYQKLAQKDQYYQVNEYDAKLWVNLTDYLDTGLFLDHRIVRRMLAEMCQGKDFLNLFAYTGTATVHAGLGGARTTTTVDMSRTYLEWAERNLRLNGLTGQRHRLIQADCVAWLADCHEKFDVIFVDPPTFSNSKRMQNSFDVQRDHLLLMQDLQRLLRVGGSLLFSNNRRGFKLDQAGLLQIGLVATEITEQTRSIDFIRNRQIHNCWLLQHRSERE